MKRILLLDCSETLKAKLEAQGFEVESGTAGYCTGIRRLPSQVYEKEVFIYNPESNSNLDVIDGIVFYKSDIEDHSPEYSLNHLEEKIIDGATFLAFVNRLSDRIDIQNRLYRWIPFMPAIEFTHDKQVWPIDFKTHYSYDRISYLAPVVVPSDVAIPVLQKLVPPEPNPQSMDVFPLLANSHPDCLGVVILRGRGRLIVLPKYTSNEDVIDTFLNRVIPKIYPGPQRNKLSDLFKSPEEIRAEGDVESLLKLEEEARMKLQAARVAVATLNRQKTRIIEADVTAKQIQNYYDLAVKQDDHAVFYLYKLIETIEHKFGGESAAIAQVGEREAWKAVKRIANESYRDARHAPRPTDVIKKWSNAELKECFDKTRKVVVAYFSTLFQNARSAHEKIDPT